jgi:hypothetical protein
MLKKLFALALATGLGLSMTAAQAQGPDHRDRGFHNTASHGEFRHGHQARHHRHHNRHHEGHDNRGHR